MDKNNLCVKKIVKNLSKRWFIDAFSGMAQGLFCTLIAGTILQLFAKWILKGFGADNYIGNALNTIGNFAKAMSMKARPTEQK